MIIENIIEFEMLQLNQTLNNLEISSDIDTVEYSIAIDTFLDSIVLTLNNANDWLKNHDIVQLLPGVKAYDLKDYGRDAVLAGEITHGTRGGAGDRDPCFFQQRVDKMDAERTAKKNK